MTTRTTNTLFMLMSVDGKISTGSVDDRDIDKDLINVKSIKIGLQQYYDLEQKTDLHSFNTGRVMKKMGWNEEKHDIPKLPVTFIVVDNKPHLSKLGVTNLLAHTKELIILTTNGDHPAKSISNQDLKVNVYKDQIDFHKLFQELSSQDVDRVTIQSGGEMNAFLLREGLIDHVSIVVAPVLIGGRDTSSLVDGESLQTLEDLQQLRPLELNEVNRLENSYLHLRYKVTNDE